MRACVTKVMIRYFAGKYKNCYSSVPLVYTFSELDNKLLGRFGEPISTGAPLHDTY